MVCSTPQHPALPSAGTWICAWNAGRAKSSAHRASSSERWSKPPGERSSRPNRPGLVHRLVKWFGLRMALPYPARLRLLARVAVDLRDDRPTVLGSPSPPAPPVESRPWRSYCLRSRGGNGWNRRHWPAKGTSRGRVAFFTGCVQDAFLPGVNRATVELLQRLGFEVDIPESQTCCGAAHLHSGEPDTALALARKNIIAFRRTSTWQSSPTRAVAERC